MNRRSILKGLASGAGLAISGTSLNPYVLGQVSVPVPGGPYTLPPLPYAYDALEPYIDAETMHLHHDKHHASYVEHLNAAVAGHPEVAVTPRRQSLRRTSMHNSEASASFRRSSRRPPPLSSAAAGLGLHWPATAGCKLKRPPIRTAPSQMAVHLSSGWMCGSTPTT